ncbi:ACP S-malonyltransferase [Actinoplanes sp. NPDC026623]|uniref:ACP S-malonyltransferase n=1 Tax=Actinoplanes sp. NPDC026623 TaxID=3155610 RepID=UPI003411CDA8
MGPSSFTDVGRYMVLDRYARARLAEAADVLGYDLLDRFYDSTDEYSTYHQLAFVVNSTALADRAEGELGERPDICAGPSFGQKAAAAYAGALSFADVLRLTAEWAELEQDYFRTAHRDVVTQTVTRVPEEPFAEFLAGLTDRGEYHDLSGRLDDGFLMVSVRESVLDELKAAVAAMGGYSMHAMRPPVHAAAFGALRLRAELEVLDHYEVGAPGVTLVDDSDGSIVRTAEDMRAMLLSTFDRPIDWPAVTGTLRGLGVDRLLITGPDNLFGRIGRTRKNFDVVALDPKGVARELFVPAR